MPQAIENQYFGKYNNRVCYKLRRLQKTRLKELFLSVKAEFLFYIFTR